jgi:hypothetical protein
LLTLNLAERKLNGRPFKANEAYASQQAYDKAEKDNESNPNAQVVLVSVEDVDSLRKAYPNYYVDTKGFMDEVDSVMAGLRVASEVRVIEDKPDGE